MSSNDSHRDSSSRALVSKNMQTSSIPRSGTPFPKGDPTAPLLHRTTTATASFLPPTFSFSFPHLEEEEGEEAEEKATEPEEPWILSPRPVRPWPTSIFTGEFRMSFRDRMGCIMRADSDPSFSSSQGSSPLPLLPSPSSRATVISPPATPDRRRSIREQQQQIPQRTFIIPVTPTGLRSLKEGEEEEKEEREMKCPGAPLKKKGKIHVLRSSADAGGGGGGGGGGDDLEEIDCSADLAALRRRSGKKKTTTLDADAVGLGNNRLEPVLAEQIDDRGGGGFDG
ncbi:hypothetical protein F4778DRAFT_743150 [Xylariomycetidae sp. FL2044]|nr:hypothetical protein F4778DRAFT_743150 [Xylariomycetidae sp. FL2044]